MSPYIVPGVKIAEQLPKPKGGEAEELAIKIMTVISEFYDVSFKELRSKSRKRQHVSCRQLIMWTIRKKTNMSLKDVGELFNRDHTTVIHSTETIENLLFVDDPIVKRDMQTLNERIMFYGL